MKLEGIVDMAKCLLIDEDSADRRRLQILLSALGLETAFSSKADDALQFCNDNAPEVVMLSAGAPGVAPKDLVKRLQFCSHGKPPVVFLYAEKADTDMFGQTILEGAADVLMMPFDRDLLQFKLRQAGVIS
jgi:two-component system, chemotaxis family, chemotaxis protein CheY